MLLLSVVLVVACVIAWFVIKDMNQPLADKLATAAKKVEDKVEAVVEKVADVNKDGVVNIADAKIIANKTKKAAKTAVEKVKKTPGRKKKSQ